MPQGIEPFHERGFRFSCAIIRLHLELARLPLVPSWIARQVLRSGTSVGANLEEAKGAQSRRDVTAKFSIALKEVRETQYWLRLLQATELVPIVLIQPTLSESRELTAILTVARRKLSLRPESDRPTP